MASFGDYPPDLRTQSDALVVRATQDAPQHAVVPYANENLSRQKFGPANPFKEESAQNTAKRKNVLTGHAQETFLSEQTFRSKSIAVERRGGPERAFISGAQAKEEAAHIRKTREAKGDATVAEGPNAFVGPWAKYRRPEYEEVEVGDEEELGSDEEYEIVEEEDDAVESGTVVRAPAQALERRREAEELGEETTTFHGSSEFDYLGRTYMHVPQDLDIKLDKDVGSITNFIPKKLVHTWRGHTAAVTALELFPNSSHLVLSGSADLTVKIWDVYRNKDLLRTYRGHNKAITDISFNGTGTSFLSASFDRTVKLWDTETGKCISRITTGKTPHVVRFNPYPDLHHELLIGLSDGKILEYDSRAPNDVVMEFDHHLNSINSITYIDEGRRFMSTSDDKSIRVWETKINVPIKLIAEVDLFSLTRAAHHPKKEQVAFQSSDNQILVYQSSDKFRANRKKSYRGHHTAGTAAGLAYSPDGQFLASGDTGGYACFWDVSTCKMYHKIKASDQAVTHVLWSSQETSKVFTSGVAGDIKLWD